MPLECPFIISVMHYAHIYTPILHKVLQYTHINLLKQSPLDCWTSVISEFMNSDEANIMNVGTISTHCREEKHHSRLL